MHLRVENSYIAGRSLLQVSDFLNRDVVITRLLHNGELITPTRDTVLATGDEIMLVCPEADADAVI